MERVERTSSVTESDPAKGRPSDALRARLRIALLRRKRLLIALCVALVALVAIRASWSGASAATLEEALALVAARSGVRVDPSTVVWLEEDGGPLVMRGAVFLGHRDGELGDLWYAEVRSGGEGTALDVASLTNLTRTGSADETALLFDGVHLAYATKVGERFDAVVVMDSSGEPDALTADWSLLARLQNGITNLQTTGRTEGFGVRRYQLAAPAASLRLERRDGHFLAIVGDDLLELDPARAEPLEGAALIELQPQTKGRPGTIAWVVDTVRGVSWIGPEPIEWAENRAFAVKDLLTRGWHGVVGAPDTAEAVARDLGGPQTISEARMAILTVTDPELGWPPAPLEPLITDPPVEGEGRWIPIVDDPYVNQYPGAPPAFYQTFIRADAARDFTRVYVTIWDPRQVQLSMMAGTVEPESATGQRGAGIIPRDDRTLRFLVGAFNGGFQALHGEFGMMADDRVYLPPKPWAATVAVFADGRVGMGSWPAPDWQGNVYSENLANRQIPEDMVAFRQNLTSVVEDGRYNPWQRWYWGAAPRNADEQTLTTRSGLCLTDEGFMGYFWTEGAGPEALGEAMLRTRCARGLHLDMNSAHCGFELFRPSPPGETPPRLAQRPRAESEFDGPFPRTEGWHLRARRAVRSMAMPFPRYAERDGRDFFYLTLRPVLPGPPIDGAPEGEGTFDAEGLPHAGWPHAFARTSLSGTWVVRIDPRRAVPGPIREEPHRRALAHLTGGAALAPADATHALYARRMTVGWSFAVGRPAEGDRVIVAGPPLDGASGAALGLDRDGFIVYAERGEGDRTPLAERLRAAGVDRAVALPSEARLAFAVPGAHAGVDGFERAVAVGEALPFLAEERPAAEVIFADNEPLPYRSWSYLQDRRVRYFTGNPPRFVRSREERGEE